jgi:hypothetical protein
MALSRWASTANETHATSKYFPVGAFPEFSSADPTAKKAWWIGGHIMHTRTLTSICGGLILAGIATMIGFEGIASARPEDGSLQIVNRTQKNDRLPLAQIKVPRAPMSDASLPEGCDSLVSSLTRSDLARIAGRCVS